MTVKKLKVQLRKLEHYTSHQKHYKTYAFVYWKVFSKNKGARLDSKCYLRNILSIFKDVAY